MILRLLHQGRILGEREGDLHEPVLLSTLGHDRRLDGVTAVGPRLGQLHKARSEGVRTNSIIVADLDLGSIFIYDIEAEDFIPAA